MTVWIASLILIIAVAAYLRLPLLLWSLAIALATLFAPLFCEFSNASIFVMWLAVLIVLVPLNVVDIRRNLISRPVFRAMAGVMPTISQTEQEALDAGDVWWEGELFSGKPNFDVIRNLPAPKLTEEEQAFLDGPVEELCSMLDDWKITNDDYDLAPEVWQFIKDNGLFALIIPKKYGGREYSALCHSEVVMKIGSRSGSAAVTVMVPNSLGPGKLLMHYGTEAQKDYYLPRLAKGIDIPCFALTGPDAGSDAGAMPDSGVVCYDSFEGEDKVLGIRLNWDKRYITLAPVATLLGLAFKLYDPDHLLGEEYDLGITLALIKRETKGVEIGRRHFPANQAFMNGPTRGKDVFIPIDWIIGGEDYIGKGWSMLMECLSDGRAISLPALGTSAAKSASKFTGAYARIRKQFNTPIGYFEGIEEALAVIGGQAYAIESARLLVLTSLDQGIVPSVISGVVKQQSMERMRHVVNLAMDIHGGHGICMGPHNSLGRAYQLTPVGITVEGANILTRTLMIFGQGAMRSHPFLLKEVGAFHNPDKEQGLSDFDNALFSHMGFYTSNLVRSLWLGLTAARFVNAPGDQHSAYYYRQLVRMSACFALTADSCVTILGGSLKRRERISGRLADALSNMYVLTAILKHYEDTGEPAADLPLMRWACDDALFNIQSAIKGVLKNLPIPFVGRLLTMLIFPLTKPYHEPSDKLGHKVARLLLQPSDTLDRLSKGIYINHKADDATGRILVAQQQVLGTSDLEKKIRTARKHGELANNINQDIYEVAKERGIINEDEYALLIKTRQAVSNAIKVDEFSATGWKVETP